MAQFSSKICNIFSWVTVSCLNSFTYQLPHRIKILVIVVLLCSVKPEMWGQSGVHLRHEHTLGTSWSTDFTSMS